MDLCSELTAFVVVQYLVTVIPYNPCQGSPSVADLQIYIKCKSPST